MSGSETEDEPTDSEPTDSQLIGSDPTAEVDKGSNDGHEPVTATDQPTGHHTMPVGTATVLAILLILGVSAATWRLCGSQPYDARRWQDPVAESVQWLIPEWRPNAEESVALDAGFDARRRLVTLDDADAKALIQSWRAWMEAEIKSPRKSPSEAFKDRAANWNQRASEYVTHSGVERYMGLGQLIADRYVDELVKPARSYEELGRWGGRLIGIARLAGMVGRDDQLRAGGDYILRLSLLKRWASGANSPTGLGQLLSPLERRFWSRWMVAANPAIPHAKRLQEAEILVRMGSKYPVQEAIAARAALESQWELAAKLYGVLAKAYPDEVRLSANASYAAMKAKEGLRLP